MFSEESQSLHGIKVTRYPLDEVLERETSFAYVCYMGEEEGARWEQDGVEDTRFTVNLSFSDYESFPLYLRLPGKSNIAFLFNFADTRVYLDTIL